jgi:hypothetical protein
MGRNVSNGQLAGSTEHGTFSLRAVVKEKCLFQWHLKVIISLTQPGYNPVFILPLHACSNVVAVPGIYMQKAAHCIPGSSGSFSLQLIILVQADSVRTDLRSNGEIAEVVPTEQFKSLARMNFCTVITLNIIHILENALEFMTLH